MNVFRKLLGTVSSFFQIGGPAAPGWSHNGAAIEAKDATNTVFANARGATPVAPNDFVTLDYLGGQTPAWLVPAWFVDPSNVTGLASNANDGQTALTPLLTFSEIPRRWATLAPILPQDTTITFLSSQPDLTDPVVLAFVTVAPPTGVGVLTVVGTLVQVGTGTFSAVTAKNRATAQRWTVTDPAQTWTPLVNDLVHDTTADAWFWVDQDLGGNTALVTEPLAQGSPSNATPNEIPIAAADAYAVLRGSSVFMPRFAPACSPGVIPVLQHVRLVGAGFDSGETLIGSAQLIECRVDPFLTTDSVDDFLTTNSILVGGCFLLNGLLIGGKIDDELATGEGSPIALDGDIAVNAGPLNVQGNVQIGAAFFASEVDLPNGNEGGGVSNLVVAPQNQYGAAFWGPSSIQVFPGGNLGIGPGQTFAGTLLQLGGLALDSAATASAYNLTTGVWTPGIALTNANLDTPVAGGGFGGIAYGNVGSRIQARP